MANIKPLANRKNVHTPAKGSDGVRFQDSTAKVSAQIIAPMPLAQTGKKGGGCSDCMK